MYSQNICLEKLKGDELELIAFVQIPFCMFITLYTYVCNHICTLIAQINMFKPKLSTQFVVKSAIKIENRLTIKKVNCPKNNFE